MVKTSKRVTFKTFEEYQAFYATDVAKQKHKGSKYYRIGQDVAKLACEKAANELAKDQVAGER